MIVGIVLILIGGFLVVFFPFPKEYQPAGFTLAGMLIGILTLIAGFVLLLV